MSFIKYTNTMIVETESEVLSLLGELHSRYPDQTAYKVKVDARKWNFEDQLNAAQLNHELKNSQHDNIEVEFIYL